jgi:hypothetical protein
MASNLRCEIGFGAHVSLRGKARRMNLNEDVVQRCVRLGPLGQRHSSRSRGLVVTTIASIRDLPVSGLSLRGIYGPGIAGRSGGPL